MNAILLCSALLIEFLLAYFLCEKDIMNPACVFIGGFLVASLFLIERLNFWEYTLHINSILLITMGGLLFVIFSIIFKGYSRKRENLKLNNSGLTWIYVEQWKQIVMLIFSVFILFSVMFNMLKVVRIYGNAGAILSSISRYRELSITSTSSYLPSILGYAYLLCRCSGYIWLYILINNYLINRKFSKLIGLNLLCSLVANLMTGARGGCVYLILSALPIFNILLIKKSGKIIQLSSKYIKYVFLLLIILIVLFRGAGNIVGRNIKSSFYDHFCINLCAPIVNLDIFMQKTRNIPIVWGHNTFYYLIKAFGGKFHIDRWLYDFDMPFNVINGKPLGNVATTYYSFYYDFGYIGAIVLVIIISFVAQKLYRYIKRSVLCNKKCDVLTILYSRILIFVSFSFLSNKFYEGIVTISFLEEVIFFEILFIFLTKIKIK